MRVGAIFFLVLLPSFTGHAGSEKSVDALLAEGVHYLYTTPEKSVETLEELRSLRSTFTQAQDEKFHQISASSLGYRGKHEERVALVQSFLDKVKSPSSRVRLLYELIDGSTVLGQYETALRGMNESILLLPELKATGEKLTVLQGALALLSSLHFYDEAMDFADRIYSLKESEVGSLAACVGLTDSLELNFLRGQHELAKSLANDAIAECEANKNEFFTLIIKTHLAMDLIHSANYAKGIASGLPLIRKFSGISKDSDYITQLENAIAQAYLKTGNIAGAESFGLRAYQRAKSSKALELQEQTSETMAAIKRDQGQLAAAISYYDINLTLKNKVLDDQLHKNLAYQRVKFDTQDKATQLALLEQKNKNLNTEQALQKNKYQNLILLTTLILVALAILGVWLFNTLRLKNIFRLSAQVDGLTQVSNRGHFTANAQQVCRDTDRSVSLVLFDMDLFKRINDTHGHATGDWVLKNVCATVKAQLRPADLVGRLGGEEFALCLPDSNGDRAEIVAERCRAAVAAIDTKPSGFEFSITASFGIVTREAGQHASYEEMLVAADKALYLSKNEGRNRVMIYQHSAAN